MKWQRLMVFAVAVWAASAVQAALVHRYSFDGDANDSVGTAHGTLIDGGTNVNASYGGGLLDLTQNTGGSGSPGEGAYVDFPNGIISSAATAGSGSLSIELWATVTQTQTWQRYVDFGTSNGGEGTSGSGSNSPYVYISPNSGRWTNGLASETHRPGGPADEAGQTGPLPNNVELHIVGTYDHNDLTAGPNGTIKLYRDGVLVDDAAIANPFDLRTFTDNNNWLGRAQWGDPLFKGYFNELRIYSNALTSAEVGANYALGPNSLVPEPASITLIATIGAALLGSRRQMR